MENFPDIERVVLEKEAGLKAHSPQELKDKIVNLVKDKALRQNFSNNCLEVFNGERRDLERNFQIIDNFLSRRHKDA
jgi:3-deoxy-D-manno-octulosonic-acid transferase